MDNTNIENLVEQIVESSDVQIDELNELDELEHHGIPGMKWGIRRYQNKDGTLTAKGKKRYNKEMQKLKEREQVLKNKQKTQKAIDRLNNKKQKLDELEEETSGKKKTEKVVAKSTKGSESPKIKSVHEMTDTELRQRVERIRLEQELARLSPQKEKFGKRVVEEVLKPAALEAGKKVLKDFLENKASEMLGLNKSDLSDSYKALEKESKEAGFHKTILEYKRAKADYDKSVAKEEADRKLAEKKAKEADTDKNYYRNLAQQSREERREKWRRVINDED